MELPAGLVDLLDRPSPCFVATLMADGSPQMTQTWVDADPSGLIRINTVEGYLKVRNMRRDPRVALNIADPADPSRYFAVRGRVVSISPDGGAEHIEVLSQKYTGAPYPWYGGREQVRLIVLVEADRVHSPQG